MDKPKRPHRHWVRMGRFIQVELLTTEAGIAMKDVPYIFDRFYRADASRNSSKGRQRHRLSIVKKIIEDHGGKIWANSRKARAPPCDVLRAEKISGGTGK